jgi:hypothetical protein
VLGLRKLISTGGCIGSDWQSNRYFEACRPTIRGADRTAMQTDRLRSNRQTETVPVRPLLVAAYSIEGLKDCIE